MNFSKLTDLEKKVFDTEVGLWSHGRGEKMSILQSDNSSLRHGARKESTEEKGKRTWNNCVPRALTEVPSTEKWSFRQSCDTCIGHMRVSKESSAMRAEAHWHPGVYHVMLGQCGAVNLDQIQSDTPGSRVSPSTCLKQSQGPIVVSTSTEPSRRTSPFALICQHF